MYIIIYNNNNYLKTNYTLTVMELTIKEKEKVTENNLSPLIQNIIKTQENEIQILKN